MPLLQQPVPRILGSPPLKYLFSTYRVGMLAMETLARRVHDDRATKYSPTPPYGDDVMWLMRVAMKLGTSRGNREGYGGGGKGTMDERVGMSLCGTVGRG